MCSRASLITTDRFYACFPQLWISPWRIHFFFWVLVALALEQSVAGVVFWKHPVCFQVLQFGMVGSAECWLPNAGPGMVARLAASESPGLFVEVTYSLAPSIEVLIHWVLGRIRESMFLRSSTNDYEPSMESTVYQLGSRKQTVNSKGLLKRF